MTQLAPVATEPVSGEPDEVDAAFESYFPKGTWSKDGYIPGRSTLIGQKIRIPKGTIIKSTSSQFPREGRPAGRPLTVTVFDASQGFYHTQFGFDPKRGEMDYFPASITWVGTGGYWMNAALRDCELIPEREL